MNTKDFTFIALRILAVYILIQSLMDLSHIANFFILPIFYENLQGMVQKDVINILLQLGPFLVQLGMSIVIWLYAGKLSRFFLPKQENSVNQGDPDQNQPSLTAHQFQVAAVSVVGLAFIVHTLPTFLPLAQSWLSFQEVGMEYANEKVKGELLFSFLEKLLRLALGFVLFFGSKGIVWLFNKATGTI
ncbi:hypothetical protein CEY16_03100 [Halalkalibacillus sediminis]|uniref:Uncharacterized protein n=1 Tax=Halalkalibacillus sediminis TaxID=2018042 RepID=A0A2I0QWR6_9BACI|nr:hypothetical protein [Halalkalibacillus sediminis]PKR78758.1 hypothetical protein CEY16_03100 [Halalkalibacillus sediminis]